MLALRHLARRTARTFATSTNSRTWKVYLSGEIHSDWREVIGDGVAQRNLPVTIDAPNTSHEDSDDCGAIILGDEEKRPNYDNKGARLNLIRTRTLIDDADVVVVRFGDKYRQWNAAFDAGYATARGKALVTLHPPGVSHMLKEAGGRAGSDRNFGPPVDSRPVRLVFERVVCARRVLDSERRASTRARPRASKSGRSGPRPP